MSFTVWPLHTGHPTPFTVYSLGPRRSCVLGSWEQKCRLPDYDATQRMSANLLAKVGIWGGEQRTQPGCLVGPPRSALKGPHRLHHAGSRTGDPVWPCFRPRRQLRRRRGTRITSRLDAQSPPQGACEALPALGPREQLVYLLPHPHQGAEGCRMTDTK